jgi:pilus assembly protein CpaB
MNNRSLITLAVAIVIGLGAMKLSQQLMSADPAKTEESQEVLVAARDFKDEEILKPDMVKVVTMVKSAVPPNAFSSFKDVADRWVKSAMLEGDILVEKKLGPKGTPPGLVANIPKGMRAFAIDVTEQSGVSGFILPGHRVDVVRFDSSDKNVFQGETILQNVLVLASGQVFTRPEERAVQSRTVTLALVPADVDVLVAARAKGSLSLALRGVNDHDVVARAKPKPTVDPEHEKRLKLMQEARLKAERELEQLKLELARKPAPPPEPKRPPRAQVATIYRGLHNIQRVRIDVAGMSELEPAESLEPVLPPDALGSSSPPGSRTTNVASTGGDREP